MQVEEELLEQELLQLQERIQILEKQQVELINIPVPGFNDGDPASIVHDFLRVSVCSAGRCSSTIMYHCFLELTFLTFRSFFYNFMKLLNVYICKINLNRNVNVISKPKCPNITFKSK